jgi:hypothetical protein
MILHPDLHDWQLPSLKSYLYFFVESTYPTTGNK